ncbi:polysaccharide biosynthesis/export family protein [Methyloligella sp. 2.7D]|uniref:polysaccharide biosynthesis/export family protein n=1 Tax=unclassified Methyloligella TaxID=2625955 RepID=UPI00157BB92C|nr:polysaccharide biosynthesis/export family protein [Methyloligella sp. GL2]QKP76554.1 polysaccharide biosynthesis/export family protein [Methyloligella sp. GL2]
MGAGEGKSDKAGSIEAINGEIGIAIGDQLKVSIFMEYGSGNGLGTKNQGVLPALVERPDLSGDYTVDERGMVFLPIAGPLYAAGSSLPELAGRIEKAYARQQEAPMRAGVQILDRQPIYVTGSIPTPAVLKYTPGMTVLQAALLAGAGRGTLADDQAYRSLDITRERERVKQSSDRLAKALALRAVLIAERDGKTPSVPLSLSQVAQSQASTLLAEASRLRDAEHRKVSEEVNAVDATLKGMNDELSLMRDNVARTSDWIGNLEDRVQSLESMFKRGNLSSLTMYTARNDLVSAQERLHDTKANIARLERDIAQAHASKTQLLINETFQREQAIQDVDDVIRQEEITQSTMGLLTQRVTAIGEAPIGRPKYQLVRQTAEGPKQWSADEGSILQPGDILKIIGVPSEKLTDRGP